MRGGALVLRESKIKESLPENSMSVLQSMLGRELPCSVLDLLGVTPLALTGTVHEWLVETAESGKAYVDVLCRLGLSHLSRQETGLARRRLAEAVEANGEYWPARLALAGVCDQLSDHRSAIEQLDVCLAADHCSPSRYALLCAAGFCLERIGNHGEAAFRYEQALATEPTDLFAHHRLAAIYLSHNQLEESVPHHMSILEAEPADEAVRVSLAHVYQSLGRHREAVWEYEKALSLKPTNLELQIKLIDQFEAMGDTARAIEQLRVLLSDHPEYPDLHLRLANLLSTEGEDAGASAEYDRALSLHPGYVEGHVSRARHELRMGRSEPAVENFQRALSINDQHAEACAGLSVALHRLGRIDEAKSMLSTAWKTASDSDQLLNRLGLLELEAEAAGSVEAAFDPDQQAPATSSRESQRQWIEAQLGHYESILDEHPSWNDVRLRYAMLLKLLGRLSEAETHLKQVTCENPSFASAWVQLAVVRQQLGKGNGVIDALQSAVAIQPEYADLHYRLGLAYCNLAEFDLAMERFEQAAALNHTNPDFQRHLWVALQYLELSGPRGSSARGAGDELKRATASCRFSPPPGWLIFCYERTHGRRDLSRHDGVQLSGLARVVLSARYQTRGDAVVLRPVLRRCRIGHDVSRRAGSCAHRPLARCGAGAIPIFHQDAAPNHARCADRRWDRRHARFRLGCARSAAETRRGADPILAAFRHRTVRRAGSFSRGAAD